MDVEGALERQVGPLPVWGWVAGGIVLIGAWMVLRRRSGAASSPGVGGAATYVPIGAPGAGAPDAADTSPQLTPGDVAGSIDSAIGGLIDYGNSHWLGSGTVGGSGATQSPVSTPATTTPTAVAVAPAPPVEHKAYGTGYSMLPDWAQTAVEWFFRSDTASGLAKTQSDPNYWQQAPEDAKAQLRQLIDQGWAYRADDYVGARPY